MLWVVSISSPSSWARGPQRTVTNTSPGLSISCQRNQWVERSSNVFFNVVHPSAPQTTPGRCHSGLGTTPFFVLNGVSICSYLFNENAKIWFNYVFVYKSIARPFFYFLLPLELCKKKVMNRWILVVWYKVLFFHLEIWTCMTKGIFHDMTKGSIIFVDSQIEMERLNAVMNYNTLSKSSRESPNL